MLVLARQVAETLQYDHETWMHQRVAWCWRILFITGRNMQIKKTDVHRPLLLCAAARKKSCSACSRESMSAMLRSALLSVCSGARDAGEGSPPRHPPPTCGEPRTLPMGCKYLGEARCVLLAQLDARLMAGDDAPDCRRT